MADPLDIKEIIEYYFHCGYENKIILEFLAIHHGINISLSTLKRRLREYGLRRRNLELDEQVIRNLIEIETNGPGELRGYRAIWHALRIKHHIHVPRQEVERIMRELNPDAARQRRERRLRRRTYLNFGPNFCWHVDGYDKLKPFGFPIHGAIDGFSRKIIWLKVIRSNNNPDIVASFYYDYVKEIGGCPVIVRTDCGTENGILAAAQCFLRQDGDDLFAGIDAHKYGSSPSNQRIEGWWSFFRRGRTDWWINFFKDMSESGMLDLGNQLHMECLWFCFSYILQKDLDGVLEHWNTHRIRRSRHGTVPGVPDVLYFLPETSGRSDCKVEVADEKIAEVETYSQNMNIPPPDVNEYQEYFTYVLENEGLFLPTNVEEGFNLFQTVLNLATGV